MVRHRKPGNVQHKHGNNNGSSSSSANSERSGGNKTFKLLSVWKTAIGCICLAVAVYIGTLGYLETRVNTPFGDEKVVQNSGLAVPDRYWGTYRPGVYMGIKAREPYSAVFGLMWYAIGEHKGIRHWCDQNDNLATYGWLRHDGVSFGEQIIVDEPHTIHTSFIKTVIKEHDETWTVRINVTAQNNMKSLFALVWYAALDESYGRGALRSSLQCGDKHIYGYTPTQDFTIDFLPYKGKLIKSWYSEAHAPGLDQLKEKYQSLLKNVKIPSLGVLPVPGVDDQVNEQTGVNFIPFKFLVETPFVLDVIYKTRSNMDKDLLLKRAEYTRVLQEKKESFDQEFEEKFKLKEKGYSEADISIARAAMSNMIGGIGYFYGAGRVQSQYTREPVPYWRAPLYTAVPSRSFFPRGFLWDEGFHGLLIGRWSPEIQLDIAAHWLDLINVEGWIPREQILGVEALARVPKEFVVQSNAAANPPMLLVQLAHLVKTRPELFKTDSAHRQTLDRMFSRLQTWYQWFQWTQRGEQPTAYRWRGRDDDGLQLNPKTLTSGLDDYPRASHPSEIERHVDLRCWMYAAADAMATIAGILQRDTSKFEATRDVLSDERLLNELHWSSDSDTYADYGLHSDHIVLKRHLPKNPGEVPKVGRVVLTPPETTFVSSAFGYVSLFPMLMKVLQPSSEKLGKILEKLDKPELMWSNYGLRSLSKSSPLYMKRNTEHDPPYWRGQVWINMNYLALSALKHYATLEGPHATRAASLHDRLRENVVRNVLSEYKRTGYLWEQYSGEDGKGSGCRPFTGWTALIVLIMADEY